MFDAIKDYLGRLLRNWVAWMSGGVGLILGFAGWWESPADQKKYFLIASVACLLVSSFAVWYSERKERLRLERESGPDIMLRIGCSANGTQEALVFENTGNEPAYNVQLQEQTHDRITAYAISWTIPMIRAGSEQSIDVVFYKRKSHSESILMGLRKFFERESKETVEFKVYFENAQQLPFIRTFLARVAPLGEQVECFISGCREAVHR